MVRYNVVEIGKPGDPTAPRKFYPRPVHTGEITLEDLADDIAHTSSLTASDVYAVLQILVREAPRNISRGYFVRLGNLGSFRLGSNSTGSDTEEEVSTANFLRARLLFHPGRHVWAATNNLTLEKIR
ncbi:HU family DNA-binding protein [Parapedobacter deserti]|uniref:HU family DNA-binding protein n=1 Tax=Parapedobacter deserti TaxID=1912957 RepID=A0ABV7JQ87_9SPHI